MTRATPIAAALSLLWAAPVFAQRVPIAHYTVTDGLANNQIRAIKQDALGYLWFATGEGLSRFDGYTFVSYSTSDGLPHPFMMDVAEDRFGHLWAVGSRGGIAHLVERPSDRHDGRAFERQDIGETLPSNTASLVASDRAGRLWTVSDAGVYRGDPDAAGHVTFARLYAFDKGPESARWFQDARNRVWVLLDRELLMFTNTGVVRYTAADGIGRDWVVAVTEDAHGHIVAANAQELYELVESSGAGERGMWRRIPVELGPRQAMRNALFDRSGRLWIATTTGVVWWQNGRQTAPTMADLPSVEVDQLFIDRSGNLWMGTLGDGVYRVAASPVITYGTREGLTTPSVMRVVEDPATHLLVETDDGSIHTIDGERALAVPGRSAIRSPINNDSLVSDAHGNAWLSTPTGQVIFLPAGQLDLRHAVTTEPFENYRETISLSTDQAGDVWIGGGAGRLAHATIDDRGQPRFERVPVGGRWADDLANRVAVDRSGAIWLSSYGQVGRIRNGVTEGVKTAGTDTYETLGRALYFDSRGWLWIGLRYDGAIVSKNPTADVPVFEHLNMASGLSSNTVRAVTEDRHGRMYFGTGRALDRFDPATGEWWHLTSADGLAGPPVMSLVTDRRGRIWIGSSGGLTMYDPESTDSLRAPSPVLLTHVRIDGHDMSLPERGARALPSLNLSADSSVLFEFVSVAFDAGRGPRYQYKLDAVDRTWSAPALDRSVTYARLAPGTYTFLVRAIGADGEVADPPAAVTFTIPAPIWRRPWFVGLGLIVALALGAAVQRVRVRQVLAMERIRRQVALDLHDDIGAGLSQIAIMSDAADEDGGAGRWRDVGSLARGLRESMSDIVWAVDPRHDSLSDLVRRMRQVSMQMLEADRVRVTFDAPDDTAIARLRLAPDRRRHVWLIFKEAAHNIAKHAGARNVRIAVRITSSRLELAIEDDGRGFDVQAAHDGHGLDSLRRRATAVSGDLRIDSTPGTGTSVRLSVPLS